jgi:hypothetical protein
VSTLDERTTFFVCVDVQMFVRWQASGWCLVCVIVLLASGTHVFFCLRQVVSAALCIV